MTFGFWHKFDFAGPVLCEAVRATFERRQTPIPSATPYALTAAYFDDAARAKNWQSFLKRSKVEANIATFPAVVSALCPFLRPPVEALRAGLPFVQIWASGGPWQPAI